MTKRTPIRIVDGKVYAWVKTNTKLRLGVYLFKLKQPVAGDKVLYEPWGKPHATDMVTP